MEKRIKNHIELDKGSQTRKNPKKIGLQRRDEGLDNSKEKELLKSDKKILTSARDVGEISI